MKKPKIWEPQEDVVIANDYVGLVAIDGRNKFLVDTVRTLDGVVSIEGPAIKWDGTLARTVRIGTFPWCCKFIAWHNHTIPELNT